MSDLSPVDPQSALPDRSGQALLRMVGISKRYGSIQALQGVDLELHRGEILGLCGDNAAGKSTLMKILYGALPPDEGWIEVDGSRVQWRSPRDAQAHGISMQYQDLGLFNNLDVAANVFAGRERVRRILGIPFLDRPPMNDESMRLLGGLRIAISSPNSPVGGMSGGQRQMIAAARAVGYRARALIMDEPTAALGVSEAASLLDLLVELRSQGVSILLITHRISDLLRIGDRIAVLKGGRLQGVLNAPESELGDVEGLIVTGKREPVDRTATSPEAIPVP